MKRVLLFLLVAVALAVVYISIRPGTYHVERSIQIAAPADALYPLIADFRQWEHWSPWEKLDPAMQKEFGGPPIGVGATYHWSGNDQVGEGRGTVIEAEPGAHVGIRLEFLKPWESTSTSAFALVPAEGGTRITWSMDGKNDFVSKAMTVFMSMDKMIGADFESGLATMKAHAESSPADTASGLVPVPGPPTP